MAKTARQNDQRAKRGQYGVSLTNGQRLFVQYFNGNVMDAARMAGYAHPERAGHNLMKSVAVKAAIKYKFDHPQEPGQQPDKEKYVDGTHPIIATRNEILIGLTDIARDPETDVREKIKAYELLGKAIGLWVTKVEVDQNSYEMRLKQMLDEEEAELFAEL